MKRQQQNRANQLSQSQQLIKIGATYFDPSIQTLVRNYSVVYRQIQQYDEYDASEYVHALLGYTVELLVSLTVKTNIQRCLGFGLSQISHIQFQNLKVLELGNCQIYSIQGMSFLDLTKLNTLRIGSTKQWPCDPMDANFLRSIKPLVKCNFPQLQSLSFESRFWSNCFIQSISRVRTARKMQFLYMDSRSTETEQPYQLTDQDISIWHKFNAQSLQEMKRVFEIKQESIIEKTLRKKYPEIFFDFEDTLQNWG